MSEYLKPEDVTNKIAWKFDEAMQHGRGKGNLGALIDAGWRIAPPEPEWVGVEAENSFYARSTHKQETTAWIHKNYPNAREAVEAAVRVLNGPSKK